MTYLKPVPLDQLDLVASVAAYAFTIELHTAVGALGELREFAMSAVGTVERLTFDKPYLDAGSSSMSSGSASS